MSQVERPDEPPRSDLLKREPLGVSVFPLVERVVGDRGTPDLDAGAPRGLILPARHADQAAAAAVAQGAGLDEAGLTRAGRAEAVHRGDQVLFLARLGSVDMWMIIWLLPSSASLGLAGLPLPTSLLDQLVQLPQRVRLEPVGALALAQFPGLPRRAFQQRRAAGGGSTLLERTARK